MPRVLIAGAQQEISTFNPVICDYDFFIKTWGDEIVDNNRGQNTEVGGAIEALERMPDMELVPAYNACAGSAGPLEHASFLRNAREFEEAIRPHAGKIDGAFFHFHGSMGTTEELDPEGYLIERAREILGEEIPFVFTGDIHGVTTARMLRNADGMATYHTYPHTDFADTGRRAAEQLVRMLVGGVKPVIARAVVPALVRGNELITETGLFGAQTRFAKSLYDNPKILNAGMQIGNPFTDVPEVCSQAILIADGDEELARESALKMAREFWPNRAKMQGVFTGLEESVREAANLESPIMFTDAADAPSSGSPGDSNAIIEEIVRQGQTYSVLAPIVDAPTAAKAHELGIGATFTAIIGSDQDHRYTPLELEFTVLRLYEGDGFPLESWGGHEDPGVTAVLTSANLTLVVHSNPINLVDRALFFASGLDPKDFHATVVKSPHCEPQFFEDHVTRNFNVDAPGSTSANLPTLGHTNVKRPIYPLDEDVEYTRTVEIYSRG